MADVRADVEMRCKTYGKGKRAATRDAATQVRISQIVVQPSRKTDACAEHILDMDKATPPITQFWRYYYLKKLQIFFFFQQLYTFPEGHLLFEVSEIQFL
jgi:hypothetical protein